MFDNPQVLEALLTGSIGSVGVLGMWVKYLISDKKAERDRLQEEINKRDKVLEKKDDELNLVTRESIGCITQVGAIFEQIQPQLQRIEEAQRKQCKHPSLQASD